MISYTEFLKSVGVSKSDANHLFRSIDSLYYYKEIPKKNGGVRVLTIPNAKLKGIQKKIYKYLQYQFRFPRSVHGGVLRRSIRSNATAHTSQEYVLNYDLKDFFPSIHHTKIDVALTRHFDLAEDLRRWIVRVVTLNDELPQGAPTSPFFANLVAFPLDIRILKICDDSGCQFTRYFDDITISGDASVRKIFEEGPVETAIRREGFKVNKSKTSIASSEEPQYVTGIKVNSGLSLDESYIAAVEDQISEGDCFYIEHDANVVNGKIAFVMSIDKEAGMRLRRFLLSQKEKLKAASE
jgi:retron-type reverse transcriptase